MHAAKAIISLLSVLVGAVGCADGKTEGSPAVGSSSSSTVVAATPVASPSASPSLAPTPSETPLGTEGTVAIKEDKVWLVCKDGTYTIDIPENFTPLIFELSEDKPPILKSSVDRHSDISFNPRLDMRKIPSREELKEYLASSLTNEPQIRDDLTEFAGNPAITTQFKLLPFAGEEHDNWDGTILSTFVDIGGTRWALGFTASTRADAEALMQQVAASLAKQ